jgi:hypothetical protein
MTPLKGIIMAFEDMSKDELKAFMRGMQMMAANIENWKYVLTNAEYLDKKVVTDALEQVLSKLEPIVQHTQVAVEIEALTKLDPYDLI